MAINAPMTEAEWLTCDEPLQMVKHLGTTCSSRKLRLFIADGVRSLDSIFGEEQRTCAEMHERVAEGQATEEDLERYLLRSMPELWEHRAPGGNLSSVWDTARMVVQDRVKLVPLEKPGATRAESQAAERSAMCMHLRCIFGNPFQQAQAEVSWLCWNDGTVFKLASAIYNDGAFDRLPILADALEDAGCDNPAILEHCRWPWPHIRGCWPVDLILGKS